MSEISETSSIIKTFRVAGFIFACLLASFAIWILAAELLRPASIKFATSAKFAALNHMQRDAAIVAAKIGHLRGDLWADAAFAYGGMFWGKGRLSDVDPVAIERTRELTEQAIAYAPYDSRLWLLYALTNLTLDRLNNKVAASLRMSYYTGSNARELIPERLLVATQSRAFDDNELRELIRHDIRIAVGRKSELIPAIVFAFNNAPLSGKQFIEIALTEIDPSLLPSIRPEVQHR